MSFNLNSDQQRAVDLFTAFLLSDEKVFVLSGAAGTGKTTVLQRLHRNKDAMQIATLSGSKLPLKQWKFTATTNKAAEVLRNAMGDASTIHSALGLSLRKNYRTGKEELFRKSEEIIRDTIVLLDEASMADSELLRYIDECTINCKYVFVGDHCQLAPVMETHSPAFRMAEPVVLNQIMRSINAPPITELSKQLRETVETGIFKPIKGVPGFIDYLTPEQAEAEIRNTFGPTNDPDARILCFTNEKVIRFNQYIRGLRNLPENYIAGDRLVSNNRVFGSFGNNASVRPVLSVEEEVEVLDTVMDQVYPFTSKGTRYELPVYHLITDKGTFTIPNSMDDFRAILRTLAKQKEWGPYYLLKENVADMRPRDASTVYKAQGSTYETAFVDLSDIGRCTHADQAARMLYVACTRPTKRICFIGDLPKRLKGV